ncbi:MAG: DNA/RNA non-specific endonuclease [Bacteroidales bacterium]|nr:DNA/RNA non-specific endonuclease [Bacteroidales bacterium]
MTKRNKIYRRRRRAITPQGAFIVAVIVMVVLVAAMLKTWGRDNTSGPTVDPTTDLTYIPTVKGINGRELQYTGFKVNFNPELHIPNYVVWTLTDSTLNGPYSRKNAKFQADTDVEGSASPDDYRRSGFDRGHMAPAADMKWSPEAMTDCHYMTNICPQDNKLNTGAWSTVENMCRRWAERYGRLIIVCGPVVTDYMTRHIGRNDVAVPERFFKVVIAPDAKKPKGIGFLMPNSYIEGGAQQSVVSIDQIEAITGYDFFSSLPDEIETEIERQASLQDWQRGK